MLSDLGAIRRTSTGCDFKLRRVFELEALKREELVKVFLVSMTKVPKVAPLTSDVGAGVKNDDAAVLGVVGIVRNDGFA